MMHYRNLNYHYNNYYCCKIVATIMIMNGLPLKMKYSCLR